MDTSVIHDFISTQKRILQSEKEYCQAKIIQEKGENREGCFVRISRTFVPKYGGTVVTFIQQSQNKLGTTIKVGSIVEVRKDIHRRNKNPTYLIFIPFYEFLLNLSSSDLKNPEQAARGVLIFIR